MFAYCKNNPINNLDNAGKSPMAIAACMSVGAISGIVSYSVGCLISNEEMTLEGVAQSVVIGAANGFMGTLAGITGSLVAKAVISISTGVISALSVDGPVEAQLITGALTATATFVSSYADTSYINNLGEFIMNGAVTAYTSGPADMLSACVQAMCNDCESQVVPHKIYGSATRFTHSSFM